MDVVAFTYYEMNGLERHTIRSIVYNNAISSS